MLWGGGDVGVVGRCWCYGEMFVLWGIVGEGYM